jgi:hypothetical protein
MNFGVFLLTKATLITFFRSRADGYCFQKLMQDKTFLCALVRVYRLAFQKPRHSIPFAVALIALGLRLAAPAAESSVERFAESPPAY